LAERISFDDAKIPFGDGGGNSRGVDGIGIAFPKRSHGEVLIHGVFRIRCSAGDEDIISPLARVGLCVGGEVQCQRTVSVRNHQTESTIDPDLATLNCQHSKILLRRKTKPYEVVLKIPYLKSSLEEEMLFPV
jgi:hypothetical protein